MTPKTTHLKKFIHLVNGSKGFQGWKWSESGVKMWWKWGTLRWKSGHSEVKVGTLRWKSGHSEVKVGLNVLQKCHLVFANSRHSISPLPTPALPCPAGVLHCFWSGWQWSWWWWWWQWRWRWCSSLLKWLSVLATGCLLIFPLAAGSTAADGHTDQNGGICWWGRWCKKLARHTLFVCAWVVFVFVSVYLILFLQLYTYLIQLQITS